MDDFVSVIVPCRNEAGRLAQCLDSILEGDYPAGRMEVLVVDGASEDGTRAMVERYAARDARVRLIDNPARITPAALNRGLAAARGEIIVRADAHATLAPDYLRRAVDTLWASGADQAGGVIETVARDAGAFAGPIVAALTHPFGVGNSHFRTGAKSPRWADTAFGGCWRREVFHRIGNFNERLERGQDLEFNLRLRKAGGKILLEPGLVSRYYARTRLGAFLGHNFTNGVWAVLPIASSEVMPVRWRHLAPLALIAAMLSSGWVVAAYAAATLAASAHVAWIRRNPAYLALMPVAFAGLHLAYGAGSAWGVVRLVGQVFNLRRVRNPPHAPDFSTVTEQPAQKATREQMAMLATRYGWAARQAAGKDVLEVACGAGLGLGWLAARARSVEAGDLDEANCRVAEAAYRGYPKICVRQMDAMSLPFEDESFDLVLLFEALYYLADAEAFFREARRVLRPGGRLLVATVNREWRGFHPSPFSTRYLSARELKETLGAAGFESRLLAGFPERKRRLLRTVRATAVALRLIPKTMAGKALLKRLFYGPLDEIPSRLDPGTIPTEAMIEAGEDLDIANYRVLYAEATKSHL